MRLYGLIGKSLRHSFSKAYFTRKFEAEDISGCRYESFELESIEALPSLLQNNPELCGLNVTIPYKKDVIAYLHEKNEIVSATGACNCIRIQEGRLSGFNTDVIGFQKSLQSVMLPFHKNALVLGTGGSSQAVQYALKRLDMDFLLVSRTKSANWITYEALDASVMHAYPVIINTTPLGMYPEVETAPAIPYDLVTEQHLLFDLVYNPEQTLFLKKGKKRGALTINGYQMLLLQAEESWAIWNANP